MKPHYFVQLSITVFFNATEASRIMLNFSGGKFLKAGAHPGLEPGTSYTLSENHITRKKDLQEGLQAKMPCRILFSPGI